MVKSTNMINENQAVQAAINELGNAFCAGIIDFIAIAITIVSSIALIILTVLGAGIAVSKFYHLILAHIEAHTLHRILIGLIIISIIIWSFIRTNNFIHKQYPQ